MSDTQPTPVEQPATATAPAATPTVDPSLALPEGWTEATTELAPTAKFIDKFGTYFDANRKIVAFTHPDGIKLPDQPITG
jgi:hypothetical protein